jgi:hypothetical protein
METAFPTTEVVITATATSTSTFTPTATEIGIIVVAPTQTGQITAQPTDDTTPTRTSIPQGGSERDDGIGLPGVGLPTEAVVGGMGLLAVLGYIALYLRGVAAAERYAKGFVIDQCPVCRRGELIVDATSKRTLGIPGARHTVRCTNCRSVLREVGSRRWRYAVDRLENIPLYDRLNNREVDEETLKLLLENPVMPAGSNGTAVQPRFLDKE